MTTIYKKPTRGQMFHNGGGLAGHSPKGEGGRI